MFRRLFAEGAFDAAFIPLFAKRLHAEGAEAARAFAGQALAGLVVLLVAFTVLAEIAMPWLMLLLAPGFSSDPEKFALAVLLARIALPYLAFMSLVALYTGVLNAYGRFAVAAFDADAAQRRADRRAACLHRLGRHRAKHGGDRAGLGHRPLGRAAGPGRGRRRRQDRHARALAAAAPHARDAPPGGACHAGRDRRRHRADHRA